MLFFEFRFASSAKRSGYGSSFIPNFVQSAQGGLELVNPAFSKLEIRSPRAEKSEVTQITDSKGLKFVRRTQLAPAPKTGPLKV